MRLPTRSTFLSAVALLLCAALPAGAQAATLGRIEGVVFDSLRARPLAGAAITVMQLAPARQYLTALSDETGRYRVDSLVAGRYSVGFGTPFLDSLEIVLPPRELTLAAGEQARADFATPSRTTLAAGACPGLRLAKGRGAIVGQVMNAETDTPLAGATIAVSWSDIAVDLKAMRATTQERSGAVTTDSQGLYRVCNVPTDSYVLLQVQRQGRAGSALRATVPEVAGVLVQNLSLSAAAAREFSAADTVAASAHDTVTRLLTGTASVTGTVRGPDGQPVADAQLRVVDAAGTARSDATGHFALGNLPAGTQLLEVRHVGFLIAQQPVELRAGRAVTADVGLSRIVTLDSVRIVAQRVRLQEFEQRASSNGVGTFLTEAQVAKLHASEMGDIFRNGRTLGFTVDGQGVDAKVRSTRGLSSFNMNCYANVVIDGMQHQDINLVDPSNIAGVEIYRGGAGAPTLYDSSCGVILLWTKR